MTIFSASNYYDLGSNRGAYVKLVGQDLVPYMVRYSAQSSDRKLSTREHVGSIESSAIKDLKHQILDNKEGILEECKKLDTNGTGKSKSIRLKFPFAYYL